MKGGKQFPPFFTGIFFEESAEIIRIFLMLLCKYGQLCVTVMHINITDHFIDQILLGYRRTQCLRRRYKAHQIQKEQSHGRHIDRIHSALMSCQCPDHILNQVLYREKLL